MSSTAAKVIAGLAIFLTLVLAVLGYRVSRQYAETAERAQQQVAQKEQQAPRILAVVALKPLAAYRKVEKDDVALSEVIIAPRDYYTSLEDVVGKEPLVDIDQGAPVTRRYFAEGNVLAKSVPAGFQAVSVEVTDIIGVGGFVRPGDIVDVLVYLRDNNQVEKTQARVLLKNTRVLAYEAMLVDRPDGLKDEERTSDRQARRQRTAVLAVPEQDTTRLMLGASLGELRLALHGLVPPGTESATLPEAPVAAAPEVAGSAPATAPGASPATTVPAVAASGLTTPGGLPLTPEALKAEAQKKVPDKAITAQQLGQVEPPPSEKKVVREKVVVFRSSTTETVTP